MPFMAERHIPHDDGYDRTLLTSENKPLSTPSAEALAPYMLAQSNDDFFLLTTNLTRLFEYLPIFDLQRCNNFAELYGSVFTSVTPQAETTGHQP